MGSFAMPKFCSIFSILLIFKIIMMITAHAKEDSDELVLWDFNDDFKSIRIPIVNPQRRQKKDSESDHESSDHHHHDNSQHKADCGFMCYDNSICIASTKVCDNRVDCPDGSDEGLNAAEEVCSCKDKVGLKKHCDSILDCPNGEDEEGCDCSAMEFNCEDGFGERKQRCLPLAKKCDGVFDCDNHKDEQNCYRLHTFDSMRGVQSDGLLQKNIGNTWYTICKDSSNTDYFIKRYAAKACQEIVGDVDHEPKVSEPKWNPDHNAKNDDKFAIMGDTEAKFTIRTDMCPSGQVFHITCPEPGCGWPASKHDKVARHRGRGRGTRNADFDSDQDINGLTAKIVGGIDSKSGDWPFIVGIYRNGTFHCGGQLIHKQWVLTAAHCFHTFEKYVYEVQAGMLRRFSWSPYEQTRQVSKVYVHERYDSKIFLNDITLLKLDAPFFLSKFVTTACLSPPDRSLDPKPGQMCSVIGWGDLAESTKGPDHMQQVELPVLAKCQETFTKDLVQICAGFAGGGKDACQGDSGGPFICHDDSGRPILTGLVSFGRGCARPRQAGVYTRISAYNDWIDSVVSGENSIVKKASSPGQCNSLAKCHKTGGECLYPKLICDKNVDCLGGEDEANCEYDGIFEENFHIDERAYSDVEFATHETSEHVHDYGSSKLCGLTEFQCSISKSCIPDNFQCNGRFDCTDETDERGCECNKIIQNVYPNQTCNNVWDCLDGGDEEDCGSCKGRKGAVKCPFSDTCVLARRWCDGMKHCPQGEDEIDCMRIVRSPESIISEGFLSDKLSRGLQSGYIVVRNSRTTWRKACEEDLGDSMDEIVCPYLGYRLKGDTTPSWSRNVRTAKFFHPRELPVGRANEDETDDTADKVPETCTQVKVTCGEALCGERRLYGYSHWNPGAGEIGAQPWFVLVAAEGSPVCPATLVHKNWAIAPTACILNHIRSLTHEYVTVISGYTEKTPIIASPLEQIKRVNGMERLSSGFSLLHLDSPIMSDHFAAPICTKIGEDLRPEELSFAECVQISYDFEKFSILEQKIEIDSVNSEKGNHFSVKIDKAQCQDLQQPLHMDSFVYCRMDGDVYFYMGSPEITNLTSCEENGFLSLINPFYGPNEKSTEEILIGPPSSTFKPPPCLGVRCSIGNCVEKAKVCDGIYQCSDFQDEKRCQRHYLGIKSSGDLDIDEPPKSYTDNKHTSNNTEKISVCPVGHFRCLATGNCVPISTFCDMENDCGPDDFSDEPIDPSQCSCRHYLELAAPERICDSEIHCPDRGDEIGCPCTEESFHCDGFSSTDNECIGLTMVCDGENDCKNGQDEQECITLSKNLTELDPESMLPNSGEGYALIRIKGTWHPYCTDEWSKTMGTKICNYLGYTNLDSLELHTLSELSEENGDSLSDGDDELKLLVGVRDDTSGSGDSFKTVDLSKLNGDEPWASCQLGYLKCSNNQEH